jgi:hypothetical protein
MIIVKQQCDQETEWHSYEYPLDIEVPKINNPISVHSGMKCLRDGELRDIGILGCPRDMAETHPENGAKLRKLLATDNCHRQRHSYRIGIIGYKRANPRLKKEAGTQSFHRVYRAKEQDCDHAAQKPIS